MNANTSRFRQAILIIVLAALAVLTVLPFWTGITLSQKSKAEIIGSFWSLPKALHPEYYVDAFRSIYRYILNSLLVAIISVAGAVFLASLSGYVFARIDFGGKELLFILVLSLMMIPGILTLIPSFLWFKEFPFIGGNNWLGQGGSGFLNSRWVLIIPYISGGQVFGLFLCRTFFQSINESLFEAARIDGASEFRVYLNIALPLSLPIIATLAIMNFVGIYNDYVWPLVTISDASIQTFSVGVTQLGADDPVNLAPIMSGYVIGSIPLIIAFAFGMKYYIEGLSKGGVKG